MGVNPTCLTRELRRACRACRESKTPLNEYGEKYPTEWDHDPSFATMNQLVWGTPPLWTTGVNGCSVIAGRTAKGEHFLLHVDSVLLFQSGTWTGQFGRGAGPLDKKYPDPKWPDPDPVVHICALTHRDRKAMCERAVAEIMIGRSGATNKAHRRMLEAVQIGLYEFLPKSGIVQTVSFDGASLSWRPGRPGPPEP